MNMTYFVAWRIVVSSSPYDRARITILQAEQHLCYSGWQLFLVMQGNQHIRWHPSLLTVTRLAAWQEVMALSSHNIEIENFDSVFSIYIVFDEISVVQLGYFHVQFCINHQWSLKCSSGVLIDMIWYDLFSSVWLHSNMGFVNKVSQCAKSRRT